MKLQLAIVALLIGSFSLPPAAPVLSFAEEPQAPAKPPSPTANAPEILAPVAKIDGPETWVVGSIAEFKCASTSAKHGKWRVTPRPDSMREYEGGLILTIGSSTPKDFTVMRIVSNANGLDYEEFSTKAMAAVNTTPVAKLAQLVPTARMEKVPLIDLVRSNDTETLAYQWCRDELKSQAPEEEAAIVARVLRNAVAQVGARKFVTPEEMVRFTILESDKALGRESFSAWKQLNKELLAGEPTDRPEFFDLLSEHITELTKSGGLATMGEYETLWVEAAKGLERFSE